MQCGHGPLPFFSRKCVQGRKKPLGKEKTGFSLDVVTYHGDLR